MQAAKQVMRRNLWATDGEYGLGGDFGSRSLWRLEFGHVGMGQIVEQTGRTLTASPLFATAIVGVSLINLGRQ